MSRPRVLVIVLAGGRGGRLAPLTDRRAKPSVPIGGSYRLIDVVLSNAVHSQLSDVWVVEQYEPHAMNDHLANGRPWDLDRTRGGLQVLPPFEGAGGEGFAEGNADALARQARFVQAHDPDVLIVASADHLYRFDFRDLVDAHLDAGAAATVVTTRVPGDASRYAVVTADPDGRVTQLDYKPDEADDAIVAAEIFAYAPVTLFETLERLSAEGPLGDYGEQLLPALIESEVVRELRHDGYWRDVGTIDAYFDAHMEMLDPSPPFRLDDPGWPVLTAVSARRPAFLGEGAHVRSSLVSSGCVIDSSVERSVLGPGVAVHAGASVRDAVLLDDVVVPDGAVIERAIVDEGVLVRSGQRIVGTDDIAVVSNRED